MHEIEHLADETPRSTIKVLGSHIDAISWEGAVSRISKWAGTRQSRMVCICNVHSVVSATRGSAFEKIINSADMATPDGAPIALMARLLGRRGQERINGPDLMWRYLAHAAERGQAMYFYGGADRSLEVLVQRIGAAFPQLQIAGHYSPPFRALTSEEDEDVVRRINESGSAVVWVGLGCPKQEQWMAAHRGRINAVMIGVGAAFDYHSGETRRAPLWMQRKGLEWAFRLASEPKRLWRRYAVTNSLFLLRAAGQLLAACIHRP